MLKKIKKFSFILLLVFVCVQPLIVYGATQPPAGQYQGTDMDRQLKAFGGDKGAKLGTPQDPRIVVAKIIKTTLGIMGTLAVVLAVYAGFLIMTSNGNEEKIDEGKKIIMYCVVGVAIILGSYSIVYFIYTGIYKSWTNPMNQSEIYIQPNDWNLYNNNTDPLEQNTVIPGIDW